MHIGVDYYPEHWPESRWKFDAEKMREAGFNVARLAEFAWARMEPEEERYDFEWLDRAIGILGGNGISVILGTPTAGMPAWVAHRDPEVLAMQKDGTRVVWGVRKNNCFTSAKYRELSRRITAAMSSHFGANPNVIGWQTDNEFGHPFCYCDGCRKEFQEWLRAKYGSLDELNKAWGNHFWGHIFSAWEQIVIPVDSALHNPGACLDWQRFFSWLNVRFQKEQVEIIRKNCPGHFITHNLMGLFQEIDYYDLSADLDFVSWDNYPIFNPNLLESRADAGYAADLMRGLKRKNFWVMEQAAAGGGWGAMTRNLRPGEIESMTLQQIAHGADGIVWFRWRTCTAGREQFWHGILGHDGRPLRKYREVAATVSKVRKIEKLLEGTTVKSDVAILYDYESLWALRMQPGFHGNSYTTHAGRFHRAISAAGVNVDLIPPSADFGRYRILVAPQLFVMPDSLAKKLSEFVRKGGTLVSGLRTGVKDSSSLCHERTLPGLLAEVFGIEVEEYECLPEEFRIRADKRIGRKFTATSFADWIRPAGADVLAGYDKWYLRPYAAATANRFGKGKAYYIGTVVKEDSFYGALMGKILDEAKIRPPLTPPYGVEVATREGKKGKLVFILNNQEKEAKVRVPRGAVDVLTGEKTGDRIKLDRFGSAVLKIGGTRR